MEQAKMPTTDEWVKKMWHLYTMEFYLSMLSCTGKWMELENIILSEVSQIQKNQSLHVFFHMWNTDPIQIQAIS
jgi:hypothetical protein